MGWLWKRRWGISMPSVPAERKGTHLCYFYKTQDEMLREVARFMARGIELGQAGVWIVTTSLFSIEDARRELGKLVSGLEQLEARGGMTFATHAEWYLAGGRFDLKALVKKARDAGRQMRRRGFPGVRASGDASWFSEDLWADLMRYEKQVDETLEQAGIEALCAYPLERCSPSAILEVLDRHTSLLTEHPARI